MSKTIRTFDIRTLDNEKDDRWRRKGVVHTGKDDEPRVCPSCYGYGVILIMGTDRTPEQQGECPVCQGTGEVYGP